MRIKKCVCVKAVTGDMWHASTSLMVQLIVVSTVALCASLLCFENLPDPCNTLDRQWLAKKPLRSDTIPLLICGLDYDHNHFNCISGTHAHVAWRLLPDGLVWNPSTKGVQLPRYADCSGQMEEPGKESLFYSSRSSLSRVMEGQNLGYPWLCGQSLRQQLWIKGNNSSLLSTECKSSFLTCVFSFSWSLTGFMWL